MKRKVDFLEGIVERAKEYYKAAEEVVDDPGKAIKEVKDKVVKKIESIPKDPKKFALEPAKDLAKTVVGPVATKAIDIVGSDNPAKEAGRAVVDLGVEGSCSGTAGVIKGAGKILSKIKALQEEQKRLQRKWQVLLEKLLKILVKL